MQNSEYVRHKSSEVVSTVEVSDLRLAYGKAQILKGVDFALPRGETLALLGPSGCGKTTLLRLVAGLLAPTSGRVSISGAVVADASSGIYQPPEKRGLGMVFQDYALWPHMTVGGNVSFPLEMRGVPRAEREAKVGAALARVGLQGFAGRNPSEISGGQQQRVAIARAIVAEPKIVLFDEPLSNLDRELRESMVTEIGDLVSTLGLTAIYVTHDQSEAFALADQVAVMRGGLIEQLASPHDLIERPATPDVAEFLRLGCVLPVQRSDAGYRLANTDINFELPANTDAPARNLLIPSRAMSATSRGSGNFDAEVVEVRVRGDGNLVTVKLPSNSTSPEFTFLSPVRPDRGERVGINVNSQQLCWFS